MNKLTKPVIAVFITVAVFAAGWIVLRKPMMEKPKELATIRLPIDVWPGNFWIIVADEKGYFEEEGLRAEITDISDDYNGTVEEFVTGSKNELDTHLLAVFDLVEANTEGADLVAVLVSDSSEGAEGLAAKKEYEGLADLKGKRIGIEVGTYLDYFLELAMLNNDIEPDQYTKVDLTTEDLLNVFEEKNLDAAFTWEPDLSQMSEKYNLHTVFDTSDIRGLSPGIFVFKRNFIERNPETVQALMNVWYKATEYIMSNKEETAQIVSKIDFADDPGNYYTPEEIMELFAVDPLLDYNANLRIFGFDSGFESLYGNLQFVSRFIQKVKNLEEIPNTNQMLNDEFLRNIKK